MFAIPLVALLVCMALALARAIRGPQLFDRILAVNAFGTKTALLIAVYGFFTGRPDFLDLSIVYTLMNFLSTIAVLRFSRYGHLAAMDREADELKRLSAALSGAGRTGKKP